MDKVKNYDDVKDAEGGVDALLVGTLQLISNDALAAVLRGEYDLLDIISGTLASRGYSIDESWIGFEAAEVEHLLRRRQRARR